MTEHLENPDQQSNRQKRNNVMQFTIWKQLYTTYREQIESIISYQSNPLFSLKFVNQDHKFY